MPIELVKLEKKIVSAVGISQECLVCWICEILFSKHKNCSGIDFYYSSKMLYNFSHKNQQNSQILNSQPRDSWKMAWYTCIRSLTTDSPKTLEALCFFSKSWGCRTLNGRRRTNAAKFPQDFSSPDHRSSGAKNSKKISSSCSCDILTLDILKFCFRIKYNSIVIYLY